MKNQNPNAPINRLKRNLLARWSSSDTPASEARFQLSLLAKDIGIFVAIPLIAVIMFKSAEKALSNGNKKPRASSERKSNYKFDTAKSQIIDFTNHSSTVANPLGIYGKKAPGTLIKIKLLNVVETYTTTPVHAQIVDSALGKQLKGGTLLGNATPDTNFDRISITFNYARDPKRLAVAVPISARALSLNGTLGLAANKKEGIVARSTLGAVTPASQEVQGLTDGLNLQNLIVKAFANGFMQELGKSTSVEANRAQVLTLEPGAEFFAELTDFFPGSKK